ncbi:hypothetical protein H8K35_14855 [Undibacterium sp. LX40W]|uniref:Uncharacterized protein n=1 Tax=Undibacterium nitidum TaxID=2762298 RepID=A0A923HWH1_9BURK|nr:MULTISPECIES: hypothetical protein [Undibacterium]MBC3882669.1 hypothetical protein [Undibacterium nitidum]MBC3892950.1 hypothetical protein [Undibacterium sp. LX40W]
MHEDSLAKEATIASIEKKPNRIADIFNQMSSVDEVRAWIKQDPIGVWHEYPRGCALLGLLTDGMNECKYKSELAEDVKELENRWWR